MRRLQILVARRCGTPLVVVTRAIGEEAAVHVLRCGAKDYLTKDKLGTLPQIIERVIAERRREVEQERLARELDAAYRRLKKLSARLVVAQERERSLISRELHDQLGQTLTGMVIHLHAAQARRRRARGRRHHTETAMEMANGAVSAVQDACRSRCGPRSSTCWDWWRPCSRPSHASRSRPASPSA